MRYPIRSVIFKPLLRWGLTDEDWGISIVGALAVFFILMLLDLPTAIPVPFISAIVILAILAAGFRYIRDGKPPRWLEHQLEAFGRSKTRGTPVNQTYQSRWVHAEDN